VLAGGPRHLDPDEAREVLAGVPSSVTRVGVFVDPSAQEVAESVEMLRLRGVQLHGSESPEFCAAVWASVIKAFRVGEGFDPAVMEPYRDHVAAVLLDTLVPGAIGGTGRSFRWDSALSTGEPPVVLAGGLRPDNVGEAIRLMRPYAVDVSSGVESSPRHKDPALMAAFVAAVRAADEELER
jgi:phosphoribosylanthranilate isomerase